MFFFFFFFLRLRSRGPLCEWERRAGILKDIMIHLQLPAVVCYYCCCCCGCCLLWLCLRRASGGDPYTRGTRSAAASSLLCMLCCFVHVEDTRPQQTATFRTAVPFWGQNTWNYSSLSPKRDCSPIRVNTSKEGCAGLYIVTGDRRRSTTIIVVCWRTSNVSIRRGVQGRTAPSMPCTLRRSAWDRDRHRLLRKYYWLTSCATGIDL